jgi:hypothetical protein
MRAATVATAMPVAKALTGDIDEAAADKRRQAAQISNRSTTGGRTVTTEGRVVTQFEIQRVRSACGMQVPLVICFFT